VDTREQTPWEFGGQEILRTKLDQGDYSLEGLEHLVSIERKSLPDLAGSITKGRDRFMREIERLRDHVKWPIIYIECSRQDIDDRKYRSAVHPNAILGTLQTIWLRFGVPFHLGGDHRLAAMDAMRLFHRIEADFAKEDMEREPEHQGSDVDGDGLGTQKRRGKLVGGELPDLSGSRTVQDP